MHGSWDKIEAEGAEIRHSAYVTLSKSYSSIGIS